VQRRFAEAFATVPTRMSALAAAPLLVRDIYAALQTAEPLPRSPITPLLFDDLNPALAAVVAGDATAAEAIEGVRRGWRRIGAKSAHGAMPHGAMPHGAMPHGAMPHGAMPHGAMP